MARIFYSFCSRMRPGCGKTWLMNTGTIKLTVFGADVTVDHAAHLKANLDRLKAMLGACEGATRRYLSLADVRFPIPDTSRYVGSLILREHRLRVNHNR